MNKFIRFLSDKPYRFDVLKHRGFFNNIRDEKYLKMAYRAKMGKKLDLNAPKTYSEKLQWLKLYDRKAEYSSRVDKFEVKKYVSRVLGEEYVIPLLGVWDRFDQIDFDSLPQQFVIKCTHDSGGVVICRDKKLFDKESARKKIESSLAKNYYLQGREWVYKNVKPRVIVERFMVDESGYDLKDYKFFCFNGSAKICMVERDRAKGRNGHAVDFFDENFFHLNLTVDGYPNSATPCLKPANFERMVEFAEKLAQGIPQVRVDFYNVNGEIYFGEFTFFHASGILQFDPPEWDRKLGDCIELPKENFAD